MYTNLNQIGRQGLLLAIIAWFVMLFGKFGTPSLAMGIGLIIYGSCNVLVNFIIAFKSKSFTPIIITTKESIIITMGVTYCLGIEYLMYAKAFIPLLLSYALLSIVNVQDIECKTNKRKSNSVEDDDILKFQK